MKKYVIPVMIILLLSSFKVALALDFTPGVSLGVSEAYNDNVLLLHSNRQSDYISYVTPGISFALNSPTSQLKLVYTPTFSFYASHSDLDTTSHDLVASGFFDVTDKLNLAVADTFLKTREISTLLTATAPVPITSTTGTVLSPPITSLGPVTTLTPLTENTATGTASYKIRNNLTWLLGAAFIDTEFGGSGLSNSKVYVGNTGLAYAMNERSTFSVNAKYTKEDFTAGSNGDIQEYTLGVTHMFTPTLTLGLTGGVDVVGFRDTGTETTGFAASALLTKLFAKGSASLSLSQTVVPAIELGKPVTAQNATLTLTRPLSELWKTTLSTAYTIYKSTGIAATNADGATVGASIAYAVRPWASLALSYSYVDFSDKITKSDGYNNNIALLTFTVSFEKPRPATVKSAP